MDYLDDASLTVSLAVAAGVFAQVIAPRLRVPALVLLLAFGVLLGPDVANIIRPGLLGSALHDLVGFAVAVILFEGGLALDLRRLRKEERAIRRLVTLGAMVTAVGAGVAVWLILGWSVDLSILFGTLVIVTGPTVIAPLLRRLRVERSVATILEAEGVLIDAVGAIVAAVALEVALQPGKGQVPEGLFGTGLRLGVGTVCGLAGGLLIALALRGRRFVPPGVENIFTLGMVVALYHGSNAILHECGVAAVIVAGIVVRNMKVPVDEELRDFKEQLTMLFIGLLFVLLAADVRLADIVALGWGAWAVVGVIIFIVRPLNVLAGTWGAGLSWQKRAFLANIGPRGIVAAAIASLFAGELDAAGRPGGNELRALVYMTIAVTVVWSGLTGGFVADWLKLRRKQDDGWIILGANPLARALAKALADAGVSVVCIDSDQDAVRAAEGDGLRVVFGNGLKHRTLLLADIESRRGAIGLTSNEGNNVLFVQRARSVAKNLRLCATLKTLDSGYTADMIHECGGEVMFGGAESVQRWSRALRAGQAELTWWKVVDGKAEADGEGLFTGSMVNASYLPLLQLRDGVYEPITDKTSLTKDGAIAIVVDRARGEEAEKQLASLGYGHSDEVPSSPSMPVSPRGAEIEVA